MNLALFDFDGTITTRDTFTPFLRFSAQPGRLVAGAVVLSPVMVGYRCGWVSAHTGRPIVARFAFQGRKASVIRELGAEYARDVLPGVVRPQALDRIEWHKRHGDTIVVASASLDAYLRCWCDEIGIDLICTELEERNGILTGRYVRGDCCGGEKLRRIRERYDLGRYSVIYAYGDTDEDREMLSLAHEKYYRWRKVQRGVV